MKTSSILSKFKIAYSLLHVQWRYIEPNFRKPDFQTEKLRILTYSSFFI